MLHRYLNTSFHILPAPTIIYSVWNTQINCILQIEFDTCNTLKKMWDRVFPVLKLKTFC